MLVIVNFGMGNLGSVANMVGRLGADHVVSDDVGVVASADKLILPGVGAFDRGMKNLRTLGLANALTDQVLERRTPILGICLGMQLFTRRSEEGKEHGLGWLAADTVRFKFSQEQENLKVPHMGWNEVATCPPCWSLNNGALEHRFYFVHSYHVVCDDPSVVAGEATYGYPFPAVVEHENLLGVQFHPEKSHKFGMALVKRFIEWSP